MCWSQGNEVEHSDVGQHSLRSFVQMLALAIVGRRIAKLYRSTVIIIIIIKRLLWRQYLRKIRAQWRNKTKGLGILMTMYNAKSRQPMDGEAREEAKKLRRIGHFEKIGFQITAKWSYISCWFYAVGEWIPQSWCGNRESSSSNVCLNSGNRK